MKEGLNRNIEAGCTQLLIYVCRKFNFARIIITAIYPTVKWTTSSQPDRYTLDRQSACVSLSALPPSASKSV